MQITKLDERESFITADGSSIRELAHPSWTAAQKQSLAEATLEPGGDTAEHFHPEAEELYYFIAGRGRMRLGEVDTAEIAAGDCVVIPPGRRTSCGTPAPSRLVLLCCCAPAYSHDDTVMTGR